MPLETVVVRSTEPLTAPVANAMVLFSIKLEKYFALDAVSTAIWERLEQPTALKDVCASLMKEFDVDPVDCERDVQQFVAELVSRGLIDIVADRHQA